MPKRRETRTAHWPGVAWDPYTWKWAARVSRNGREYGLLRTGDKRVAISAAKRAASAKKKSFREFMAVVKDIRANHANGMKAQCTSQYQGVSYNKQAGKWRAYATVAKGKRKHIGTYKTELAAHRARLKYLREMEKQNG